MKRIIPVVVALLFGVGVGWYFGYTQPLATDQRKVLREYQSVRDAFSLSDEQMAEIGAHLPEMRENMKRSDEYAAAVALNVFHRLEGGNLEGAKTTLTMTVASYYHGHRHDGNSNVLANIERMAATNATLAYWLTNKVEWGEQGLK